jgi:hypothetical protein
VIAELEQMFKRHGGPDLRALTPEVSSSQLKAKVMSRRQRTASETSSSLLLGDAVVGGAEGVVGVVVGAASCVVAVAARLPWPSS